MYGALKSSMTIWTPSCSMVMSSARRMSSKAMPYCMPEQPPPLTKTRSANWGLPSLARSSLRRVRASEVSETTACSITFSMLARVPAGFGSSIRLPPPAPARTPSRSRGGSTSGLRSRPRGASNRSGRSIRASRPRPSGLRMRRRRLASAQLEPLLGRLALGAHRSRDQLRQRLGAAGDGALRVGQDQDLAADGGFVGLGAVEVDLDREFLLQRPHHVFPAHDRLGDLVVEGEDDAAGDDVEHIGKDLQQLAHVFQ